MSEPIRILCVDDEVNILNVIRRQLCDLDVELHPALSAEEGLRFLMHTQPVQVVISDYRLPGMNGIDFLKKVATEWPAVTGILLSGFADLEVVQDALEQGRLLAVLHKPWKAEELQKLISEAVGRSAKRTLSEVEPS
ncbi:response regulator [Trichlorobacter lovleyi]|uniref:response regulator n=1 Tax=Trichlorobacter lovleyi TaxID=313985 RepID=UPI0024818D4E|nr:response regulator [Trichlorobacter lovleyi]